MTATFAQLWPASSTRHSANQLESSHQHSMMSNWRKRWAMFDQYATATKSFGSVLTGMSTCHTLRLCSPIPKRLKVSSGTLRDSSVLAVSFDLESAMCSPKKRPPEGGL